MRALFSLLAFSLTIGFASVSKAVVVDRLQCKMKISDSAFGESSEQEQELNIPRLPGKTGSDFKTSDASAKMEVKFHNDRGEIYRAQPLIHYRHAFKKDAQGNTLEARQTHCIGLTGEYRDPRGNTEAPSLALTIRTPSARFQAGKMWPLLMAFLHSMKVLSSSIQLLFWITRAEWLVPLRPLANSCRL